MGKKKRFLRDLARGGKAEELVSDLLNESGLPSFVDKETRLEWDVQAQYGEDNFTVEVKFDAYEAKSGNIAIEVYNPRLGKPSGITATQAFFWAHVLVDKVVWMTTVKKLKQYLDKHRPSRIIDAGGDNNATLWLYPGDEILPGAFVRVDTMTPHDFLNFVVQRLEKDDD